MLYYAMLRGGKGIESGKASNRTPRSPPLDLKERQKAMNKTIDLARLTGGKMMGEIDISAYSWETRYSWGHTAEVSVNYETVARAKFRYYNRTWEAYCYQSVIHAALRGYVHSVTGLDPLKAISKRDTTPMKSAAAESRRLNRVAAHDFAVTLYNRVTGIVDGTLTYEDIEKMTAERKVA